MKSERKSRRTVLIFLALILVPLGSCTKWESPTSIYSPGSGADTTGPVITGLLPADYGMAGYRELTIVGQNFPADTDSVAVWFQDKAPVIKSLSREMIVVYRPMMDAGQYDAAIKVKVVNPFVVQVVKSADYVIEAPVTQFCDLHGVPVQLGVMDFDKNGYLYAAGPRRLFQITPDGAWVNQWMNQVQLPADLALVTDMKFGPGGFLYCEVGTGDLFRLDVVNKTKVTGPFVSLPYTAGNLSKFDFDTKGNFYTSGDQGVIYADTNGNATATGHYGGSTVVAELRVIGGYLYAAHGSVLSRNVINSDGSLGSDETVVDVKTIQGLSGCTISSFNLDVAGTVYVSLYYGITGGSHPTYSVFVVNSQTSVIPFYEDERILPAPVDQILWTNNSRYLYLNRSTTVPIDTAGSGNYRLYRMGTIQNGAPYNGRAL